MPIGEKININPLALYNAKQKLEQAQGKQQRSQGLAQGNFGAVGYAGMAANLIGGLLNLKHRKATDSAQSDWAKADFEERIAKSERAAEKKAREKYQEAQEKIKALVPRFGVQGARAIVFGGVNPSDLKQDKGTTLAQNLANPETRAYLEKQQNKPGMSVINNLGKNSDYQVGKIPEGYALIRNAQGQPEFQKISGSPQQEEAHQEGLQGMRKTAGLFADHNNINSVIDKSIQQAGVNTTGFIGSWMKNIPGSEAADLQANLKTIQADAAFSSLQNMRDNSKTGGALGQVSERELGLLSSAKAALEQSQSPEQFKENLLRYQQVRKAAMQRTAEAYKQDYGSYPQGFEQPQESQQKPQVNQIIVNPNTGERMKVVNGQWVAL